jgi:methionine-gamma-lyase
VNSLKFDYMCEFGGALSPFNAWLLLRGMKTLGLRMRAHEANALAAARYLQGHPKVSAVYYPGLEGFPGHALAASQMSGFGAIVSFEVQGGLEAAKRVVNGMRLFKLAVSLGDCETLVQLPAAMTHRGYDHERLKDFGLSESMIRISLGLEDIEDILEELDYILAKA